MIKAGAFGIKFCSKSADLVRRFLYLAQAQKTLEIEL